MSSSQSSQTACIGGCYQPALALAAALPSALSYWLARTAPPQQPAAVGLAVQVRTSSALCTSLASGMKRKITLAPLAPWRGTPAPLGVMAKS